MKTETEVKSGVLSWSRSFSLYFFGTGSTCCGDELLQTTYSRYDVERFGCKRVLDPKKADLLIVSGSISKKAAPLLKEIYDQLEEPKYVMAVGSCACGGGLFHPTVSQATILAVHELFPVDVFVPACPPRPEAILNGLILLQEKIRGSRTALHTN